MIKKIFFILLLLSVNISAAAFMIIESASYYSMLTHGHAELFGGANLAFMPWLAAILAEIFQHIMMIMNDNRSKIVWFFRFLAGIIFCLTVIAASYRILKPIEIAQTVKQRTDKIASILLDEIKDNRADREVFRDSQRLNTAVSVIERRDSSKELKELYKSNDKIEVSNLSTVELIQLFFLRLAIQLSALTCAWKIGSIYRSGAKQKTRLLRQWRVPGEIGFVGIAQLEDKTFIASTKNSRGHYKTLKGAMNFFNGTKYAGKIPLQPIEYRN